MMKIKKDLVTRKLEICLSLKAPAILGRTLLDSVKLASELLRRPGAPKDCRNDDH